MMQPENHAYLHAYQRRRIAAACTAIKSAAVRCLRQKLDPTTTAADFELAQSWHQHLGFPTWKEPSRP